MKKTVQKHPRLPAGYGTIKYYGAGRRNPYGVFPPHERNRHYGKALCYVPDWYTGFAVLTAYKAGTYEKGMEYAIHEKLAVERDIDAFCERLIRDHAFFTGTKKRSEGILFKEAWGKYTDWKFGEFAPKKLSETTKAAVKNVFRYLSAVHDEPLANVTLQQLQDCLNRVPSSKTTRRNVAIYAREFYRYALQQKLCEENAAQFLSVPHTEAPKSGVPFTEDELRLLWEHAEDPICEFILIMCYSGFRISAYPALEVNFDDLYFRGGVKTEISKNRIVPIHSAILPLVRRRLGRDGTLLKCKPKNFYASMKPKLLRIGITAPHHPHECRHTFSTLCERYGVREADRKRMMGHSFGSDITNGVYGHRTLEELRAEIEKIQVPKTST